MISSKQTAISPACDSERPARVALINMPFSGTSAPSIQCGLLKAQLIRAGHEAKVYYLNLELAAEIGAKTYEEMSNARHANSLLGDWLFSAAAFGYQDNEQEYIAACPGLSKLPDAELEWLFKLRKEVLPNFIQRWTKRIDWCAYDAVGFTSTFVQTNASFALAQSIKSRHPGIVTIFGGANFDGGMGREFLRTLSFMDYVVDGEGEEPLSRLADRLARGESGIGLQGVSGKTSEGIVSGGRAAKVTVMDGLPEPDYDDYFETLWRLGRKKVMSGHPVLPFETARGCWWGEKHHCTFCGLNANDMSFRSKTAERVLGELESLTGRYHTLNIQVVDNIINVKYIDKVCLPLIQAHSDYAIFWEVKANLTPAQLRTMASAGIVSLQPGIESLSTHVLELMRKGITMLKNVRFLKWGSYFNIKLIWNMLTGFPGETEGDYEKLRRLLPLLKHLPPPGSWGPVWLERYSPYFSDPSFPVSDVAPVQAYQFLYPGADVDLREVAYFFDYKMGNALPQASHEGLYALLQAWKDCWDGQHRPSLLFRRGPGWIQVSDHREEKLQCYWLYQVEASAYEACCETDHTVEAVLRTVREQSAHATAQMVEEALKKFCDLGIMIEEDGHYLSLAQPINRNWFLDRAPAVPSAVKLRILEPSLAVRSG